MKYLSEIFLISTFSSSKLVKQCFVELLSRMKKIDFPPFYIRTPPPPFFYKNIARRYMYWSIQFVVNKIYVYVCVYFLYCDTLEPQPYALYHFKAGTEQRRIQDRRTGRAPPCLNIFGSLFMKILTV